MLILENLLRLLDGGGGGGLLASGGPGGKRFGGLAVRRSARRRAEVRATATYGKKTAVLSVPFLHFFLSSFLFCYSCLRLTFHAQPPDRLLPKQSVKEWKKTKNV